MSWTRRGPSRLRPSRLYLIFNPHHELKLHQPGFPLLASLRLSFSLCESNSRFLSLSFLSHEKLPTQFRHQMFGNPNQRMAANRYLSYANAPPVHTGSTQTALAYGRLVDPILHATDRPFPVQPTTASSQAGRESVAVSRSPSVSPAPNHFHSPQEKSPSPASTVPLEQSPWSLDSTPTMRAADLDLPSKLPKYGIPTGTTTPFNDRVGAAFVLY